MTHAEEIVLRIARDTLQFCHLSVGDGKDLTQVEMESLTKEGLAEEVESPEDRWVTSVRLTSKGHDLAAKLLREDEELDGCCF